ncbi:AraC family transcriptional regulator [Aquimarina sp. AU474]|uniref:helix-turn-helix domain-containing protein n=1 Tax=Aquimarina sp. AU474 TaxID=2108529 RepID=UPI000D6929EE|nr:helix-turn-helix domain-containing protein [Aquimarina sp. AU474]
MITFLNFIIATGLTITIMTLVLILKQVDKRLPQIILIAFYFLIFFMLLNLYTAIHQLSIPFYVSFIPHDIARWLIGPLLYLYVKSLFLSHDRIRKSALYHLIPTTMYLLFFSIPLLIEKVSPTTKISYLDVFYIYEDWLTTLTSLYTLVYLVVILYSLKKYVKKIKSNYSNLNKNDLNWVKLLIIGGVLVVGFDFSISLYQNIIKGLEINSGVFTLIAIIVLISYLGYYGIGQSNILLPKFILQEHKSTLNILSSSSSDQINELENKLKKLLQEKKPYLNQELTLIELANLMSITDKKLSALLNNHMNISFYDLINGYRVMAVKKTIDAEEFKNYTLLGIALTCGFNSKASFNRVFKKETGLSPSQYKKGLK